MGQIHVYARLFLSASDDAERMQVFSDAVEWLEAQADTTIEKGLKSRVFAMFCTREGADFLRWVIGHEGEDTAT